MKKIRYALNLLLLCSMLFCACNKQNENEPVDNISEPEIMGSAASGMAQLQCGDGEIMYGVNKEGTRIFSYDVEIGSVGENLVEGEGIQSFCYGNGCIYYVAFNKLYEYAVESEKTRELAIFDGEEFYFDKMVVAGNSVFILRKHQFDEAQSEVRYDLTDEYNYEGEVLLSFDLAAEKLETVAIANIKCVTSKSDSELLIYAYDGEGGFYFTTYHVEDKSFSEKRYRSKGIRDVMDIAYDSSLKVLFFLDLSGIQAMTEEAMTGASSVYESEGMMLSSLQCREGITYALEWGETEQVIRLVNSTLNLATPVLKAYTLSKLDNTPSNGFQIEYVELTAEELTTKILAGDTDYDFLLLNSQWDLGYHVSRIGAYAELNDIPGVEEFLAECHTFAGEAASKEDGSIWMLPYNVEAAVLCYNEMLFQKLGLTLSDIDTMEELYSLAEKNITEETAYVDLSPALLATDMLRKYHANYGIAEGKANYDTDLFRHILDIREQYEMKGYDGTIEYDSFGSAFPAGVVKEEVKKEIYENTLFKLERSEQLNNKSNRGYLYEFDFFHAAPMPDLENGSNLKEEVQINYLVINPKSEKLPWVKLYVEQLCEKLKKDEESFLLKSNTFSDKPLYQEIQEILSNAQVTFLYPSGIVSDAMYPYLFEGKSFEDTVTEIERVMNMYMHE